MNVNAEPTYADSAATIYDAIHVSLARAAGHGGSILTPPALDRLTEAIERSHWPNNHSPKQELRSIRSLRDKRYYSPTTAIRSIYV